MSTSNDAGISFPPLSDKTLELPDGRILAYRTCGMTAPPTSSSSSQNDFQPNPRVVYAFHGALGTGDFDLWSAVFEKLGWFVISPTLPGWGLSTPNPGYTLQEYAEYDIVHLTKHIFESVLGGSIRSKKDQQFCCLGISFGCIHALSCAVHLPNRVRGLHLLGPHGPFDDPSFDPLQGMALPSRMGLGSMGYYLPWLTSFTAKMVQNSVSTPAKARQFVKLNLLDVMNDAEKKQLELACQQLRNKISSGQGLHDSMSQSIEGYVGIPSVLRSWTHKDCSKVQCPTHIFVAEGDVQTPAQGARYIHNRIKGSKITIFKEGGHMTLVFCFDKCVEMLN